MKKVALSLLLAGFFAVISPANALDFRHSGIKSYVDYEVGVRLLAIDTVEGVETDIDPGFVNSILVGYADETSRLRKEIVSSFGRNNYKSTAPVRGGILTVNSNYDIWTVMGRGIYDIHLSGRLMPFIGAGVGWSRIETSVPAQLAATFNLPASDSESYLTYSAMAGFRLAATGKIIIGVQYAFTGYGSDGFAHDTMASFSYAF